MNLRNTAYFFIVAIAVVVVLIFGKSLLIPFIFALLLWFTIREIRSLLDRISLVRKKFPSWAKNLLTSTVILTILGLISTAISSNINSLARSYKKYEANIDLLLVRANDVLNIDLMEMVKGHFQ